MLGFVKGLLSPCGGVGKVPSRINRNATGFVDDFYSFMIFMSFMVNAFAFPRDTPPACACPHADRCSPWLTAFDFDRIPASSP